MPPVGPTVRPMRDDDDLRDDPALHAEDGRDAPILAADATLGFARDSGYIDVGVTLAG